MATEKGVVEKVLTIKDNSVVIVRGGDPFETALDLSSAFAGQDPDSVAVINLPEGMDISVLDEKMMEMYGWIRKPKEQA